MGRSVLKTPTSKGLAMWRCGLLEPCDGIWSDTIYEWHAGFNQKQAQCNQWCIDQNAVAQLTELELMQQLLSTGLLMPLKRYPSCGARLSSIWRDQVFQGLCPRRHCRRRLSWFHEHLSLSVITQSVSVKAQHKICMAALAGSTQKL